MLKNITVENLRVLSNNISDKMDDIKGIIEELVSQSFQEPSLDGFKYHLAIDLNGNIEYMCINTGAFMGEHEGTMVALCDIPSDLGLELELGEIIDSLDNTEYEEFFKWHCESNKLNYIEEDIEEYACELNDWELLKEFRHELYDRNKNAIIEYYVDEYTERYSDKVYETMQDIEDNICEIETMLD